MSHRTHLPQIEGLTWLGQDGTEDTLHEYHAAGAEALRYVLDWDETLVPEKYITWNILRNSLPRKKRNEHLKLYHKHRPQEANGTLTVGRIGWSGMALSLQLGNTFERLQRETSTARMRRYGRALLVHAESAGVPDEILTSGVQDIIEMMMERRNLHPSIFGVKLLFESGKIVGWDADSLINTGMKSEANHPELNGIRAARPHALLIGDQLHDADMVEGDALRIRIINERMDTERWYEEVERSKGAKFDAVIPHLRPAVQLGQWIMNDTGLLVPN